MVSDQKNAFLAISLSALILFGWQYFFAPKFQPAPVEAKVTATTESVANKDAVLTTASPSTGPIEPAIQLEEYALTSGNVAVSLNSNFIISNYSNPQAAFNFLETVGSKEPLKVVFDFGQGFQSVTLQKLADNKFFDASHDLTVISSINDKGVTAFNVTSSKPFRYKFIFSSKDKRLENGQQRYFSVFTDKLTHLDIGEEETQDQSINWAGIDFNYHLFGLYFEKESALIYKNETNSTLSIFSNKSENAASFNLVYVKKDYDYLASLGHKLQGAVDFGIWGLFAAWILKGLQFFYTWFPNYGISIILLTFLIRLVTFPLQYKSIVSMKKLQLVQPELNKIREKFKDDPQRMQKESMDLFKRSGANPIGGCLPLLLQMPVFFAFYKVLNHSVELVGAPFFFWIHDLSNKDPYFVLPVLMTGAMFLQQKLTPNTVTDPVQRKMMLFMPLVFGFIMKDLPSGLSLYIFVSTVLGILQQVFVFNSKKSLDPVVV
jgi:YidC/Oxa1 family membrane protein insertase